MSTYTVYLSDVSYFSGKLEGALRAKRIDYARVRITPNIMLDEVLPNTGWMKVPAMRRADGLWLNDTTPILRWLDAQHPERPLIPRDPAVAFLSALVEDYCDEWQWRPAMFWRWAYPANARYLASRLGAELAEGSLTPAWLMGVYFRHRQRRTFVWGDGVTPDNFDAVSALYPQALDWLESLLTGRRYLLGDRPSLVDIAWFGPMFRHYAQDPAPAALMAERAPRVWAWVSRLWNSGVEDWAEAGLEDFSDPAWDAMFADIDQGYLPYLHDNARALTSGQRRFDGRYAGIEYRALPPIHYRARCLATLQAQYAALAEQDRGRVEARLAGLQISQALRAPPARSDMPLIDSALAGPARRITPMQRLRFYLRGTPWDAAPLN